MQHPDDWIAIARWQDLEDGSVHPISVRGVALVLVRDGQNVYALSGHCTHDHAPLATATLEDGAVVCPRHRARFDLIDGAARPGFELPALATYPVRVQEGNVLLDQRAIATDSKPTRRWDLTRKGR